MQSFNFPFILSPDFLSGVETDIRLLQFLPSVVAAATMLQVISGLENAGHGDGEECPSQLLDILANDKAGVSTFLLIVLLIFFPFHSPFRISFYLSFSAVHNFM